VPVLRRSVREIFALEGHPVLHRDAAAEGLDVFNVMVGDGLAMVKEPVQAIKWNFAVHLFIHV
jgi:hypothetical protein